VVWGPRERNALPPLFDAVCQFADVDEDASDGPRLGDPGVLEACAADAGLAVRQAGDVAVPYEAADAEALTAALELDLVHSGVADRVDPAAFRQAVERAAAPHRGADGSYRFENSFRWLIAEA
jgi:hypothetical protein